MNRRIALLVDADQWPPTSLFALLEHAQATGSPVHREVFGAFDDALKVWVGHTDALRFQRTTAVGRNEADGKLIDRATELATKGAVDSIWIATRDRKLLKAVAERLQREIELVNVEDPAPLAPAGMKVERGFRFTRMPIPRDVIARIRKEIAAAASASDGTVLYSYLAPKLGHISHRDLGRESLLDLIKEFPEEFQVEEGAKGGAVGIRLRETAA